MKIAIGIATAGRRAVLADTVRFLSNQTRTPDEFIICPGREGDLDPSCLADIRGPVRIVSAPIGLCPQRNAVMAASDADVMVFFDDDFLPAEDFLAETERLFMAHPQVVVATGHVLADDILGPGFTHEEGIRRLQQAGPNQGALTTAQTFNAYGCNMAIRLAPVRQHGLRFDEGLPLYAWLEDVDFSRQMAPYGDVVRAPRLRGVHLGTKKSGRSPGCRLGYSQIANRIHILRKGHMSLAQALNGSARNLLANLFRSIRPEPWVDRRGRLQGNALALWDWVRGRVDPERILKL